MQLNSKQILKIMIVYYDLNDAYEPLLDPVNFVKNFKTMDEFKEWAEEGTILDVQECIKVFEKAELYEHCVVMQDLIKDLI